ncbi:MAG: helix-turn-helix domain-containing protein [Rhodospirillales bacterium]|nr:helix-turn-helix domain-containing protein [Rhodospirillales bacterium]
MYHYTDCGLRNVWLANGFRRQKTPYGPGVAIEGLPALHRAIGLWLAGKPRPLTGSEVRFLRKELDLSQKALAAIVGQSEQTVSLWERRGRIPQTADRFVRALYRETAEGNAHIRDIVARLALKDADDHETRATFAIKARRWKMAA